MDVSEIITQTPAIGAILLIVAWNHKSLSKRDCTLKDIADHCHELKADASEAIRENSRALGANAEIQKATTVALQEVAILLRTVNGKR